MVHSSHDAQGQRTEGGNGGTNKAGKTGEKKRMSQTPNRSRPMSQARNDGGPAFPGGWYQPGMSLRDYFAAKAMAAILTHRDAFEDSGECSPTRCSRSVRNMMKRSRLQSKGREVSHDAR